MRGGFELAAGGVGSSGSRAAISVSVGGRAGALDFPAVRVGAAPGLALAEAPVPTCRSRFSTRRTRLRMIASRCRISFCSPSTVGFAVRARADREPGNMLPSSTHTETSAVLISPRRASVALNRSVPPQSAVSLPPTAKCRLSATAALQSRSVVAATGSVAFAHRHAQRRSQRDPWAPRSQATCAGTYRSSSCGFPRPDRQLARGRP